MRDVISSALRLLRFAVAVTVALPAVWTLTGTIGASLPALGAQPAPSALAEADEIGLSLTGRFQLRVDGELDQQAQLFLSDQGSPRVLVVSDRLPIPIVVTAGARKAKGIEASRLPPIDELTDRVILSIVTLDGESQGVVPVVVDRGEVSFAWNGQRVRVEQPEPILGQFDAANLLEKLPEYRRTAARYEPQVGTLRLLGQVDRPTVIEIFFGSWCPHCEKIVPRLIAVTEKLDNPNLTFLYNGVPRKITDDPLARQYDIKGLPTVIVRRGNTQLARLEGRDLGHPEMGLASVLFGSADAPGDAPATTD